MELEHAKERHNKIAQGVGEAERQYARDKLLESGEAENLHGRHLDYFLAFARRLDGDLHSAAELAALEQLERRAGAAQVHRGLSRLHEDLLLALGQRDDLFLVDIDQRLLTHARIINQRERGFPLFC